MDGYRTFLFIAAKLFVNGLVFVFGFVGLELTAEQQAASLAFFNLVVVPPIEAWLRLVTTGPVGVKIFRWLGVFPR